MTPEDQVAYLQGRVDGLQRMILSLREQLADAAVRNAETEAMLRQEIDLLTRSGDQSPGPDPGEPPTQVSNDTTESA